MKPDIENDIRVYFPELGEFACRLMITYVTDIYNKAFAAGQEDGKEKGWQEDWDDSYKKCTADTVPLKEYVALAAKFLKLKEES